MANSDELKRIKKKYGENFMKLCRELFPTILERDGKLEEVLNKTFAGNSRTLYEDIVNAKLERAFKNYIYGNINARDFKIDGYTLAKDGRFYKYNIYLNKIYYCPENIVIEDGTAKKLDNLLLMDYFICDRKDNIFKLYDNNIKDSFIDFLQNLNDINMEVDEFSGQQTIIAKKLDKETITIVLDQDNQIIGYKNLEVERIGDNFLYANKKLIALDLPNLKYVGDNFLLKNELLNKSDLNYLIGNLMLSIDKKQCDDEELTLFIRNFLEYKGKLDLPLLETVGNNFLESNKSLTKLELHKLKQIGNNFLRINNSLSELDLLNVEKIGDNFLELNKSLTKLELHKLKQIGNNFLRMNSNISKLDLPNVEQIGDNFLEKNNILTVLTLIKLKCVGNNFLLGNCCLRSLQLPQLEIVADNFLKSIGNVFLPNKEGISLLQLPKLKKVGDNFLHLNENILNLELLSLMEAGDGFLSNNRVLEQLNLPKLRQVGDNFLQYVGDVFSPKKSGLNVLILPSLEYVGNNFLSFNESIVNVELLNLIEAGDCFLCSNKILNNLKLPKLKKVGKNFLLLLDKEKCYVECPFLQNYIF